MLGLVTNLLDARVTATARPGWFTLGGESMSVSGRVVAVTQTFDLLVVDDESGRLEYVTLGSHEVKFVHGKGIVP